MIETIVDPATDIEEELPPSRPGNPAWVKGMPSPNPGGRPKDPVRDYLRRKFHGMSDSEIEQWLIEHKVSGEFQWRQAEGNPTESKDIRITTPTPILGGATALSKEDTKQIQGEIAQEVLED